MPRKLFFDIETIPAPKQLEPRLKELYELKKAKKATRGSTQTPQSFSAYLRMTSLDGSFGRICCLAYAIDDQEVQALAGDERSILEGFWAQATPDTLFIGHNVFDFDLPFVIKRSRILGVRPSVMPNLARYRSNSAYDTMHEWTGWGRTNVSLHALSVALGLPTSKDDIDGSQVADYFAAGKLDEIVTYCKKDVELTRQVYDRMTFDGTIPDPKRGW
ncbi:MAG TPA: ribonuclease H-like domain-containing protein [Patescibacteria group bacterium]|jgi:hypothetical protein